MPAPAAAKSDAPPPPDPAREQLRAMADNLPKIEPKGRSSNMLGNVALFVAACAVFIVVMYAVNKDAPKETSPFMGGPAPGSTKQPQQQASQQSGTTAQGGGAAIKGTIAIDPGLAASAPNGSLFVIVRMSGVPPMGPPLAVKKFDSPQFPQSFEIGPGDMMQQGMPWTGPFDITARLDADGNAMTKAPGDLTNQAPKSGVVPGATDVAVTLDKRL